MQEREVHELLKKLLPGVLLATAAYSNEASIIVRIY